MGVVSVNTGADGCLRVLLRGEIDYTNAGGVLDTVRDAIVRDRPSTVVVDLSGVTFLDSSGIAVLVKAMKAARDADADYRVTGPGRRVLDQLRMTGLVDLFEVDVGSPPPPHADAQR